MRLRIAAEPRAYDRLWLDPHGRTRTTDRVELERGWPGAKPFVGINLDVLRMIDGDELRTIQEHRLFELVRDAHLVLAVARAKLLGADADVFVRVGRVPLPGGNPVAHLAAAEKVRHELEPGPVPGKEERARRGLAIQLRDLHRPFGELRLQDAGWPQHAHAFRRRATAKSEQQIGRADRRRRRRRLEPSPQCAGTELDLRADTAAVADPRRQLHADRRVPAAAVVAPDAYRFVAGRRDQDIAVAVVVDIG